MHLRSRYGVTSLLALLCLGLPGAGALAQAPSGTQGWSGTLGAGVVAFPKYVGGTSTQSALLPIAYVDYNDWLYVDLYRAGAYVWSSQDKKQGISLAVEPRIGFNAGDGPRLAGMASRHSSLFGGVTYNAESDLGSMSLGYFTDLGSNSRGGYFDLLLNRPFVKNERWSMSGTVEVSRSDSKLTNYYFGVAPGEVTAARPLHTPGAATNLTLWLTGQYNVTKEYALMFGANVTRLGSAAASSPIVERRDVPFLYLGVGRNL
jgi:outer membrane protein